MNESNNATVYIFSASSGQKTKEIVVVGNYPVIGNGGGVLVGVNTQNKLIGTHEYSNANLNQVFSIDLETGEYTNLGNLGNSKGGSQGINKPILIDDILYYESGATDGISKTFIFDTVAGVLIQAIPIWH